MHRIANKTANVMVTNTALVANGNARQPVRTEHLKRYECIPVSVHLRLATVPSWTVLPQPAEHQGLPNLNRDLCYLNLFQIVV